MSSPAYSLSSRPALGLRLAAARYRFRESLFQLPALIVLAGVLLAEATAALDRAAGTEDWRFTLSMDTNAATWLLSTVAGATITTAGVVFSLTLVSLQLASSQFSPRVMRSFIRDRLSQVVIGLLVATFAFSVLTLRHLEGSPGATAPSTSMTVAVVLVIMTVLLIIAHLDHLAARLQVGEVVRAIFEEGEQTVADLAGRRSREREVGAPTGLGAPTSTVTATTDGWVTQAPGDRLLQGVPDGAVVRLETRTGAYIHAGEPLARVWLPSGADPGRVADHVRRNVLVAGVRTMQDDVDFAIRQLVDVGLRALSPAVNDPTTAVESVLRVGGLMRGLLVSDLPAPAIEGNGGGILLRPWELTHGEYVAHAFDQLRQAAGTQTQVLAALLRVLRMLVVHCRDAGRPEHLPALERQLQLVVDEVRGADGLHPAYRRRLLAVAEAESDPAEHA